MKYEKFDLIFYVLVVALLLVLAAAAHGQTLSGGTFTLEKSVVAGGGRENQSASMSAHGTSGQTVAGHQSSGGNFTVYSGFWTPETFAPTAATAAVGGRILSASGKGIRNVMITVTAPSGESRTTLSGASGYYRFDAITVGETYIFTVSAKRFRFNPPTQIRQITEDAPDINFIAIE